MASFMVDRLGPQDLEGALRLSTQAGWNQIAADWTRLLDLSPEGCLAGRLDGALVATATLASYGDRAHWIGMVLVDEALRGKGLGSQMLARVVERGRGLEGVTGLDATDLGRPVYLKQGFADVAPIDRWAGILKAQGAGDPVEMLDRSNFDEIVTLDHASCGADRSDLLLHLMHEPGVFALVSRRDTATGFAFLRPGLKSPHVGPVVALDEAAGIGLLNRLSRLTEGAPVLLDALRDPFSSALLHRHGLMVVRRLTRMTLGAPHPVLMGRRVLAATSFEWG